MCRTKVVFFSIRVITILFDRFGWC